jgi:hypothetical protein
VSDDQRSSRRSQEHQDTTTWFEEPVRIELSVEELLADLDEDWARWDPVEVPA